MNWPRSSELASRLTVVDEAGSTNDILAAQVADSPDFAVVATLNQTGGRGRLGRTWVAPAGKSLAVSVLLKPRVKSGAPLGVDQFGWLPLIAGEALCEAVDALVGGSRTRLKWPNDVQIDGRKVSGILAELQPSGDAVIIGSGVNLTLGADEFPVPTATSLALAGVELTGDDLVDAVLGGYLAAFRSRLDAFLATGGDARGSGILDAVTRACSTLGQEVRVQLPGDTDLLGVATAIDSTGRLVVRRNSDGLEQAVAAGDVTHLRYE